MIRQDNRGDVLIVKSIASKEKKREARESQKPNSKQGIFNNRTFCVFAYMLLATTKKNNNYNETEQKYCWNKKHDDTDDI